MNRVVLSLSAALLLTAAGTASAHAQMPRDNDAWKGRCKALSSLTDISQLPPQVRAWTRNVDAGKFTSFAFERSEAGQPAVACTMFYLGAIAAQNSNDASLAHDNAVLAGIEIKNAQHKDTTFGESVTRMKAKVHEISKPALTNMDAKNVLDAASTIPYTEYVTVLQANGGRSGR